MATSQNQLHRDIGELSGLVRGLTEKIESNETRNREAIEKADLGRARVHERLDDVIDHLSAVDARLKIVEERTAASKAVTDQVVQLTEQAKGAGTAGRWLLRAGIVIVSAAGWLMALYTQITGKPPP